MNLKSITFRCSAAQLNRLERAMSTLACENRTNVLAAALEEFLQFAEQKEIAELDLFELVNRINTEGSACEFSSQA